MKKVLVPAIEKAIKIPEVKVKIEQMGYVVEYRPPAELKKLIVDDYEKARFLATKLNLVK